MDVTASSPMPDLRSFGRERVQTARRAKRPEPARCCVLRHEKCPTIATEFPSDADALRDDPRALSHATGSVEARCSWTRGAQCMAERLPPGEKVGSLWRLSATAHGQYPSSIAAQWTDVRFLPRATSSRRHGSHPSGNIAEVRIPSLRPAEPTGASLRAEHFATGPTHHERYRARRNNSSNGCAASVPIILDDLFRNARALHGLRRRMAVDSLKALVAISEQLTPSMRTYTERRFGRPSIRCTASWSSAWSARVAMRAVTTFTTSIVWSKSSTRADGLAKPERRDGRDHDAHQCRDAADPL